MLNSRVLLWISKPIATEEPQGNPLWRASPSFTAGMGIRAASSSPWQTRFLRAALQTSSILPGAAWTISGEKKQPKQNRDWVHWAEQNLQITLLKVQMWSAHQSRRGKVTVLLSSGKALHRSQAVQAAGQPLLTERSCYLHVHLFHLSCSLQTLTAWVSSHFIAVSPGFSCKQVKRLAKLLLDGLFKWLEQWNDHCRSKNDRNQKLTCFRKPQHSGSQQM